MAVGGWVVAGVAVAACTVPAAPAAAAVSFGSATPYAAADGARGIDLADFNDDGHADVVTANSHTDNATVLLGEGAGHLAGPIGVPAGDGPTSLTANDFTGDSEADLAIANGFAGSISLVQGHGNATFSPIGTLPAPVNTSSVQSADLNHDNRPDLAYASGAPTLFVRLATGPGTFAGETPFSAGATGVNRVRIADVDGDGNQDLVAPRGTMVTILYGDGFGGFGSPDDVPAGGSAISPAVADLDGDGHQDLAITKTGQVGVLLADGAGGFDSPVDYDLTLSGDVAQIRAGDVSGDGNADIVVATHTRLAVLEGVGDGTFLPVHNFDNSTGVDTNDMKLGDLNGDGKPDVITVNPGLDNVSVFLNDQPWPPFNRSAPAVLPAPSVGAREASVPGHWLNAPTAFRAQWVRCDPDGVTSCVDLMAYGGHGDYAPTMADLGHTLRVRYIATNADGDSAAATSAPSALVILATPLSLGLPVLKAATPTQGARFATRAGRWTGAPTFQYRWLRCDAAGGACAAVTSFRPGGKYKPVAADVGLRLRSEVKATNAAGSATATSAPSDVVMASP